MNQFPLPIKLNNTLLHAVLKKKNASVVQTNIGISVYVAMI